MKNKILVVASGILAIVCLFLAVSGISALVINGAFRAAEAE